MINEFLEDFMVFGVQILAPTLVFSFFIYMALLGLRKIPGLTAKFLYRTWVFGLLFMFFAPVFFWGLSRPEINNRKRISPVTESIIPISTKTQGKSLPLLPESNLSSNNEAGKPSKPKKRTSQATTIQISSKLVKGAVLIWFLGLLGGALLLFNAWRNLKLVRDSLEPAPLPAQNLFAKLVKKTRPNRQVLLGVSDLKNPMAIGFKPGWVALPKGLSQTLPSDNLSVVICHEIAHLKRFDDWQLLVFKGAQIISWPNPFVHLAQAEINRFRECACDEDVLRTLKKPGTYANTLAQLFSRLDSGSNVLAPALLGKSQHLKRRIAMILKPNRSNPWISRFTVLTLTIFLGLGLLGSQKAEAWFSLEETPEAPQIVPISEPNPVRPAPGVPPLATPKMSILSDSFVPVALPPEVPVVLAELKRPSNENEELSAKERERIEKELALHAQAMEKQTQALEAELTAKFEAMSAEMKKLETLDTLDIQEDALRQAEEAIRQVEENVLPMLQEMLSTTLPGTLEGILEGLMSVEEMADLKLEIREEIRAGLEEARIELEQVREDLPQEIAEEMEKARQELEAAREEMQKEKERYEKEKQKQAS